MQPDLERAKQWMERASIAIGERDLPSARRCFSSAIKLDQKNASLRFNLAIVHEALSDRKSAAEELTKALRLDPGMASAARRLCWVLGQRQLPSDTRLDRDGMIAALAHNRVDRDLLCAAILHSVGQTGPLARALELARDPTRANAAQDAVYRKAIGLLSDELVLAALRSGIVSDANWERLLTSIRRALLLEPDRWNGTRTLALATALMQQCWLNEHVWAETQIETEALAALEIAATDLAMGSELASLQFAILAAYRDPLSLLPSGFNYQRIASAPLRGALLTRQQEAADLATRERKLTALSASADATTAKVAKLYQASPYPRWTSILTFRTGELAKRLSSVFSERELTFLQRPFEVLIAGCGTGRQAVSAAIDYGDAAHVTGIDVSAVSLAYADRMADQFNVRNLALAQGDIAKIESFQPTFSNRFHIVECVGVLHHMADPFEGWRRLLSSLAPGGIMLIGLYSRTARRNLVTLRKDAAFPGIGCDLGALRRYRQHLAALPRGAPGHEFIRSSDFFSASGFRDFHLHVEEHTFDLSEIETFLDENGLQFRGFFNKPFELLQAVHPDAVWPGTLAQWKALEQAHPDLFLDMYQFWCTRG